jgi:hypothetical protein
MKNIRSEPPEHADNNPEIAPQEKKEKSLARQRYFSLHSRYMV